MEENNSIQDQGDVVKGTKVPHATPVKHFFCVYLALLIGLGIKMAAVFPFVDTEFTSQATTTPLILVIVIAPVAIMFTGRFWVFNVTSRRWVQFSAVCFTHVVVILLLVDAMQYRDFWGMPPVMQLGFYWTYSYHLGILYFSALVITTLILSTELFSSNINVNHQPGNRVLSYGLTIGGICWVISWTFLDAGMFWSFFIDACVSSTAVVAKLALLVITMRKVKQQELDGTLERIRAGNGADDVFKNGRNGTLHVFKGAGMQLLIFFCIAMEVTLLSVTISKPNMLPVLLQVFPLFFAGFLLWGFVYRVIKDRFWLLVIPCILLVTNAAVILSDPYGYLVYASATYWLAGLSIPGFIMGSLLHVGAMANGMFSRLFWGSFATFVLAGSIIIALMMKWDSFCIECAQIGVLAGVLAIAVFSIGRLLSGINGFWNKGKRSRVGRDARESLLGYTRLRKQPDSTVARVAIVKSDMLLLALVASGIVLVPLSIGAGAGVSSCEHVLGSYNKDYYLWFAESTRTIDAKYQANLPASPVNSTVHLTLARGEHEGFQVMFTPWEVKPLNVWSFGPKGDLKRPGASIGAGNISVFNVEYVSQLQDQYPDRIHPFSRLDTGMTFTGQRNWPFFVDVGIPADDAIEPGVYSTTMLFHCYDYHHEPPGVTMNYKNRDVTFTLEVEVRNFTVPLERHVATEIIWSIAEQDPDWVDFFSDHRLDWYFGARPIKNISCSDANPYINFDWPTYFAALDPAIQGGMRYYPVAAWGIPGLGWDTLELNATEELVFSWYLGNLTAQLGTKTTPWNTSYLEHAYYFIRDEPPEELYQPIADLAAFIHSISPDLKVMETMNNALDTYPDAFLEDVDIYCQHVHHWEPSLQYPRDNETNGWPERLAAFVQNYTGPRQKELWVYHTHNRFPTPDTDIYMSGIMQRNSFWLHWVYGVPGWLYWSFNWGTDMNNGYGYAGYGESTLIGFGEQDKPVSSLRLERVRDGIEDYEYFWLLNASIAKLEIAGQDGLAYEAGELLSSVSQLFNQPQHIGNLPVFEPDDYKGHLFSYNPYPSPYLELRESIGALLGEIGSLGILP